MSAYPHYPDLFKTSYPVLQGKDWLRRVNPEDRAAFSSIGREFHDHGRMGGEARARTARRDSRGRFAKNM